MITAILAQVGSEPFAGSVEPWLKDFFWLATGLCGCVLLINQLRKLSGGRVAIADQPLRVIGEERFATKEEHLKLEVKVDVMTHEIKQGFDRLDQKRSVSVAGLHELVRSQGEKIAAHQSATMTMLRDLDDLKRQGSDMHSRVDTLPARTIALLRETKGLI